MSAGVRNGGSAPASRPHPYVFLVEGDIEDQALALRILKKYRISNHVDMVEGHEEAIRLLSQRLGSTTQATGRASETAQVMARPRSLEAGSSSPAESRQVEARATPGGGNDSGLAGIGSGAASPGLDPNRPAMGVPELVLLTFGDGRPSPLDTIRRLRILPGMDTVPLAVCCRNPDEERVIRDAGLNRVSCLSKPFGFFKLLECIQKMDMHWFVFAEKP